MFFNTIDICEIMYIMGFNMLFAAITINASSNIDIGKIIKTINFLFVMSILQKTSQTSVHITKTIEATI